MRPNEAHTAALAQRLRNDRARACFEKSTHRVQRRTPSELLNSSRTARKGLSLKRCECSTCVLNSSCAMPRAARVFANENNKFTSLKVFKYLTRKFLLHFRKNSSIHAANQSRRSTEHATVLCSTDIAVTFGYVAVGQLFVDFVDVMHVGVHLHLVSTSGTIDGLADFLAHRPHHRRRFSTFVTSDVAHDSIAKVVQQ